MIDIERIKELTKQDRKLNISAKALKLSEEVGEVSTEVLSYIGASNTSKSAVGTTEALAEEVLDVIIVAHSILAELNLSENTLRTIAGTKLNKWQAKINGYYNQEKD